MDNHRTVLGILFLVLGAMGAFGMTIVTIVFVLGSAAIGVASVNEPDVPGVLAMLPAMLGLFVTFTIAASAIPSLIAGYGLLRQRPWARIWALVAGIVNLPSLPFGTGVGVYAIWFYLQSGDDASPETYPASQ